MRLDAGEIGKEYGRLRREVDVLPATVAQNDSVVAGHRRPPHDGQQLIPVLRLGHVGEKEDIPPPELVAPLGRGPFRGRRRRQTRCQQQAEHR